jgi:hypothetical protein
MTDRISVPAVPNLPRAKDNYSQLYLDQLTNVLRLYFNQLNGVTQVVVNELSTNAVFTVSTLPSAVDSGIGFRAFVTDSSVATFGSVVAAGGANKVPVYSDGVDWKVG